MTVKALQPDYRGEVKDRLELFHGNQLLYIGWDQHMMVCAPLALALPSTTSFRDLVHQVLPTTAYAQDSDWPKVDWSNVEWLRSGKPFEPEPLSSLADNGLGHKSMLRFRTPHLSGIPGSSS